MSKTGPMSLQGLECLLYFLKRWEQQDFTDLPSYGRGYWSRNNLTQMTDDVSHRIELIRKGLIRERSTE